MFNKIEDISTVIGWQWNKSLRLTGLSTPSMFCLETKCTHLLFLRKEVLTICQLFSLSLSSSVFLFYFSLSFLSVCFSLFICFSYWYFFFLSSFLSVLLLFSFCSFDSFSFMCFYFFMVIFSLIQPIFYFLSFILIIYFLSDHLFSVFLAVCMYFYLYYTRVIYFKWTTFSFSITVLSSHVTFHICSWIKSIASLAESRLWGL